MNPEIINAVFARSTNLYTAHQVEAAVDTMAKAIHDDLHDKNPILLSVMIGGVVPTGMLMTRMDFPMQVDYVHATRYNGETSGSELEWLVHPRLSLKDRTVLIIDDILDGGITLSSIVDYCREQGASDVRTAVLVEKCVKRLPTGLAKADYTGVEVEDRYVYGYGMDYKNYLRNAPGIYVVAPEDE